MNPLNLSKFKKVRVEKDHTVLQHPEGHEIKIAHKTLSPEFKQKLDTLPMADGGNVKLQQAHKQDIESPQQKSEQHPNQMAEGGMYTGLPASDRTGGFKEANSRGNRLIKHEIMHYDDGGNVPAPSPVPIDPDKAKSVSDSFKGAMGFKDGGQPQPSPTPDPQSGAQQVQNSFNGDTGVNSVVNKVKNLLPHFAKGTPDSTVSMDSSSPADTFTQGLQQNQQASDTPMAPKDVPPDTSTAPQQPDQTLPQQGQQAVDTANAAESANAANTQKISGQSADIYGEQGHKMDQLRQHFEDVGDDLHSKFDDTATQVANGQIDPTHWWTSKSTGNQILTAVGMLFSGAGMGVAGHPEMASNAINNAIDRDIDAQKANLANKNTLLGKYNDMYNNLPQAEAAARLTMQAGVEGMINQQAMKLNSADAMNTAQIANSQRRMALLPQMEGLARGQVMSNLYGGMAKTGVAPSGEEQSYQQQMQNMRILNPDLGKDMENKYLPNVGVSRVPIPDKLREDLTTRKDLSDKLGQLEMFSKEHSGTMLNRAVVNQGHAMALQVQDAYRRGNAQGVFREAESKFVNSILGADPTSFFSNIRSIPGYTAARKFNDQTVQQYYKSYGIRPFSGSSQSQQPKQQSGPQEGQQDTSKSGKPIVFKQGNWVYQ